MYFKIQHVDIGAYIEFYFVIVVVIVVNPDDTDNHFFNVDVGVSIANGSANFDTNPSDTIDCSTRGVSNYDRYWYYRCY